MTDAAFQKLIIRCRKHLDEHQKLLILCEKEYEKRFGSHPSDWDDDFWIDTLHYGTGSTDLKELMQQAEFVKELKS